MTKYAPLSVNEKGVIMLDYIIVGIFILGTFGSLFYIYKKTNFE